MDDDWTMDEVNDPNFWDAYWSDQAEDDTPPPLVPSPLDNAKPSAIRETKPQDDASAKSRAQTPNPSRIPVTLEELNTKRRQVDKLKDAVESSSHSAHMFWNPKESLKTAQKELKVADAAYRALPSAANRGDLFETQPSETSWSSIDKVMTKHGIRPTELDRALCDVSTPKCGDASSERSEYRRLAEDNHDVQPALIFCGWLLLLIVFAVVYLYDRRVARRKRDAIQQGQRLDSLSYFSS